MKRPIATASTGVARANTAEQLHQLIVHWDGEDAVVVQESVDGPLAMVQSVWDRGELVAFHSNLRVREGVRGGAGNKRSVVLPDAQEAIERLGVELDWHGALSADVILTDDGPLVIDVNPRLVEPVNASRSGVDLVGALLAAALRPRGDRAPAPVQLDDVTDVTTHQLILNMLGAAQHHAGTRGARQAVLHELCRCISRSGAYAGSTEELTPPRHDLRTLLPVAVVATSTVAWPPSWERFASGNVANYAIAPEGWDELCSTADRSGATAG